MIFPSDDAIAEHEPVRGFQILEDLVGMVDRGYPGGEETQR